MYEIVAGNLELEAISRSGQCFRMTKTEDGGYLVCASDKRVLARQGGEQIFFSCGEAEFREIWYDYFDLGTDYGKICELVDERDEYLKAAVESGRGIRILRQDLWEMLITFLISQNNNIPRIKNSVEALCRALGPKKRDEAGDYYGFPAPEAVAEAGLSGLSGMGLGYRDRYVLSVAETCVREEGRWLRELKKADYGKAHEMLLGQTGVGKKVADCVCLFGLHHIDAFPVDTHIRQILDAHYPKGFPAKRYEGCAGVMQQYMFYHKRNGKE